MSPIDQWLEGRTPGAPVTADELLALLSLLPPDEVPSLLIGGRSIPITTEMVSVGEKSDRLYLESLPHEIEVTPEMIEAGACAVAEIYDALPARVAVAAFRAMIEARPAGARG